MKKALSLIAVAAVFMTLTAFTFMEEGGGKYIGSNSCKGCHNTDKTGKQYTKWEATPHAKAFKTLQSAEADKIAAGKGFKTKAAETPECLACHVSGKNDKAPAYDASFKNDEGIGCEACHGGGSGFKMLHMKKENLDKAKAAGLMLPNAADGSAEKMCKECHNAKSPTHKEFKFAEMWKKIAHPLPAK
jgi:hypothetical protein